MKGVRGKTILSKISPKKIQKKSFLFFISQQKGQVPRICRMSSSKIPIKEFTNPTIPAKQVLWVMGFSCIFCQSQINLSKNPLSFAFTMNNFHIS